MDGFLILRFEKKSNEQMDYDLFYILLRVHEMHSHI